MDTRRPPSQEDGRASYLRWHDELRPTVRSTVRRHLRNIAEADEVEQEVMVELWLKADRVDWSDGSPHGWATIVAKRRAIDHLRSDRSRVQREDRADREQAPTMDLVAENVIVRLDRAAVVEALDVLNPKQREAIVLAYFSGLSYSDVARSLGLPLGTVKRRIRDGTLRLRSRLSDQR